MSLDSARLEALRDVRAAFPSSSIALIGATALGLQLEMKWRNSIDLDLAIAVSVDEIDELRLPGWERVRQHKWKAPRGVPVDIVPAPPEAVASGMLVWSDGATMRLAGISLALNADTARFGSELSIAVPSIPVIALLKMAAYIDQPHSRDKDLKDLAYILDEYPPLNDDRVYTLEMFDMGLDVPQVQAFILGRELRDLCPAADRTAIEHFLEMTADGAGWVRFVNESPWRYDEEKLRRKLEGFRRGFAR
jgi:predicted nucleotidyltransferase